ncbi:MAG: FlgD immunoglobulin-like domain containing protein [Candidatus Neomarinimicrobiota bacterium]
MRVLRGRTIRAVTVVLALAMFSTGLRAQPDTLWTMTLGRELEEEGLDVQQTFDGGFIIVGYIEASRETGNRDIWLIRTNASGDTIWTKTIGGSGYDMGFSVQQTPDSGFVVGGLLSLGQGYSFSLIRTDTKGDTLWTRSYGGGVAKKVKQTWDGGFLAIGDSHSDTGSDVQLVRCSPLGEVIWSWTYGLTTTDDDRGYDVVTVGDSAIFILGTLSTDEGGLFLMRVDTTGNIAWTRTYGWAIAPSFQHTSDDGFVILGSTGASWGGPPSRVLLIRANSEGDTLWTRTYEFEEFVDWYGIAIQEMPDNGFALAATAQCCGDLINYSYAAIIRTDDQGDTLWVRRFAASEGYSVFSSFNAMNITADSGLISTGRIYSPHTKGNLWIVRLASDATSLSAKEKIEYLPTSVLLFQTYPNPFNPITTIRYDLPLSVHVQLIVYNILGREVVRLVEGLVPAGSHSVVWHGRNQDGRPLPSGIYLARLATPGYTQSIKMLLLR